MGNSYRVRIGIREIQAMQPNTVLWDLEVKGFVARRQFSDVITFSVVYRTREGVQRWQKLERYPILTPHLARQEAIRVLRAKALGQDPAGERMALRHGPTVSDLCDEYSARDNGKKPGTIRSDNSRIKQHIKPKLGKLKVAAVTNDHVEEFMLTLSAGSKSRVVGLLGAIFSYAVKRKLVMVNPCVGVEKPAPVNKTRRLSDLEYQQLHKAICSVSNPTNATIFTMIAITGWRSGEVRLLKFSECDLERRIATLSDTKTGLSVRPLSVEAIRIIEAQQRRSEYVFDYGHGAINTIRHNWLKFDRPPSTGPRRMLVQGGAVC